LSIRYFTGGGSDVGYLYSYDGDDRVAGYTQYSLSDKTNTLAINYKYDENPGCLRLLPLPIPTAEQTQVHTIILSGIAVITTIPIWGCIISIVDIMIPIRVDF